MLLTEMLRSIRGDGPVAEIPFHSTAMGRTFLEYTMPELVRELKKLNANLEKFNARAEVVEEKELRIELKKSDYDDGGR